MYEKEKDVEAYFQSMVRRVLHGKSYKFISPGNDGVPDRVAILPRKGREALVRFVEMKRPGGVLRRIQVFRQAEMRNLGAVCDTLYSREDVDAWVEEMKKVLR